MCQCFWGVERLAALGSIQYLSGSPGKKKALRDRVAKGLI